MTAIWHNDGAGWRLLAPAGFPDEHALHGLVEDAPQLLPLAGAPQLTVLGREVALGGNYADLIAVERSGRLAVVEIKLGRNAEARRAVVAQVLTYAAYLRGMDPATLEGSVLAPHLRKLGQATLADAVAAGDQQASFEPAAFAAGLAESLGRGWFRLVLVLDAAPEELVRLVGYLEAVTDNLVIDLITVSAYDVGGAQGVVPQRIDPERPASLPATAAPPPAAATAKGWSAPGAGDFVEKIGQAPDDAQPILRRLAEWAIALECDGLANLWTYHGVSGRWTLLPYLPGESAGLVTLWNDKGASVSFWRSVFERRAPAALAAVERAAAPTKIAKGTTTRDITEELLDALTAAYREAATGTVRVGDRPAVTPPG